MCNITAYNIKSTEYMIINCFFPEQMLHVHPAGVPEDPHGGCKDDRVGAGLHLPAAPHSIRHEVSVGNVLYDGVTR